MRLHHAIIVSGACRHLREATPEDREVARSAITLVQVDQLISADLIAKIAAVEGMVQAKVLGF